MRALFALLILPAGLCAQPQPPSFHFVLAQDQGSLRPMTREVHVVQHYRERVDYVAMNGSWLRPEESLALVGGPLFRDSTERWQWFSPREGVAESYVLVMAGADTMRLDLPEDPRVLMDRALERGWRDSPEVFRFRKGRYAVAQLITQPWESNSARKLSQLLIAEDEAAHQRELAELEEYYRKRPPPMPPAPPYTPPPPMTEQDWVNYWAAQPPLKQADIHRVSGDTVRVRFTGRVMLNGGCGSGMPLFGIEMLTDTGWVERLPLELVQMDCGMPWADWEDHEVMMPPLRWWVGAHQPEGKREVLPGRYRMCFIGGDNVRRYTTSFMLE